MKQGIHASVELLNRHIEACDVTCPDSTGAGASNGTRMNGSKTLQKSLIWSLQAGVLTAEDIGASGSLEQLWRREIGLLENLEPLRKLDSHALPPEIVRGMMLIRANSLLRGYSGVRYEVIEAILALIAKRITPVVPLRGGISASGDLHPLAYLCGALEGNPDIYVNVGPWPSEKLLSADVALEQAGLESIVFAPMEASGLLKGSPASCSAAAFAIFQARQLAILAQLLTAMGTEALRGSRLNHHPFIASTRPHSGQTEVGSAIFGSLDDSELATQLPVTQGIMAQDCEALRTAAPWIGPQLEDLMLALTQIETELNSTTDDPILDTKTGSVHYGGNFQAASLISAMDKTLSAVQMLGRLIHAQCSALFNPRQNKGLPPNLCEPDLSSSLKGVDINMSAYMSELAHTSHPVTPFMQSAERHIQSVNSLSLITARNVLKAIDILSLMASSYIYALCQALDLRCLQLEFFDAVRDESHELFKTFWGDYTEDGTLPSGVWSEIVWPEIKKKWIKSVALDLKERADATAAEAHANISARLKGLTEHRYEWLGLHFLHNAPSFIRYLSEGFVKKYEKTRNKFFHKQSTPLYLCYASHSLYTYVRGELKVPLYQGLEEPLTLSTR